MKADNVKRTVEYLATARHCRTRVIEGYDEGETFTDVAYDYTDTEPDNAIDIERMVIPDGAYVKVTVEVVEEVE